MTVTDGMIIRQSTLADLNAIETIYPLAFPDEELLPLVIDLLADPDVVLSLVGELEGDVVGHVLFTRCGIDEETAGAALLGPLAVTPSHHGLGIGSAMVRAGLEMLRHGGTNIVLVLGDPAFYGRLCFETDSQVRPPYALPAEWANAWQSQKLGDSSKTTRGRLAVPAQWRDPTLWSK